MFWLFIYLLYFLFSVMALVAGFVFYLIWFQSDYYFPKPTGKYAVGTKTDHWIDTNRKEIFHEISADKHRELMVTFWYPVQGTLPEKPTTPYVPYAIEYLKKNLKMVWLMLGFSRRCYCYAQADMPFVASESLFPVIIFLHGNMSYRESNTAQCEDLASHGFIVLGLSQPFSSVVQFPDDCVMHGINVMAESAKQDKNPLEFMHSQLLPIVLADINFVLDQLKILTQQKDSIFYQRIDLNNVGLFGHSAGACLAIQACRYEPRIKAAVALDGNLIGPDAISSFDKPLMFILSSNYGCREWTSDDFIKMGIKSLDEALALSQLFNSSSVPAIRKLAKSIGRDVYAFVINNAGHADLSDASHLKQGAVLLKLLDCLGMAGGLKTQLGPIDGFRVSNIVNMHLVDFFNKYLKDEPSELLGCISRLYLEVDKI
jgi:dienelactone hydrolase